jgi:hypothetical protein
MLQIPTRLVARRSRRAAFDGLKSFLSVAGTFPNLPDPHGDRACYDTRHASCSACVG